MRRREFLTYSALTAGSLPFWRWVWQGTTECYAVDCERIESTTRHLLDERPRRRKDEIQPRLILKDIFTGEGRLSLVVPLDSVRSLYYYFTQKVHRHQVKRGKDDCRGI